MKLTDELRIEEDAKEIARLRKALEDIKRHYQLTGNGASSFSAMWLIADKALRGDE